VIYSAAPFQAEAVKQMLPLTTILVLNEVEAAQLSDTLGGQMLPDMIVTRGARGASWAVRGGETVEIPAFVVEAVDTTGAGDCFIGSVAACLDLGMGREEALRYGAAAAALQVSRPGTADAMPTRDEVLAFLGHA